MSCIGEELSKVLVKLGFKLLLNLMKRYQFWFQKKILEVRLAPLYLMIDILVIYQLMQLPSSSHELNHCSFTIKFLNKLSTKNALNNSIEQPQLSRKGPLKFVEVRSLL